MLATTEQLAAEFNDTLGIGWYPPKDLMVAANAAIRGCEPSRLYPADIRRRRLLGLINWKFRLNKERFQNFLDGAAARRVFLNYHDKRELLECLDLNDARRLRTWLEERRLPLTLGELFKPLCEQETLAHLAANLKAPVVVRSDARKCDAADRRQEVLRSLFGSYVFSSFPQEVMHGYFNPDCRTAYLPDFYQHLRRFHPTVLHRDCALILLVVDNRLTTGRSALALRNLLCEFVRRAYGRLSNHCYMAILIRPFKEDGEDAQWRLFSDLVLYAEKHREVKLRAGYFPPEKIERATKSHIMNLDPKVARFDIANEGFFFRDCIVLSDDNGETRIETSSSPRDILLLFEKNERDETLIPCPACRSRNVRGNSYPVLGVKSWECQNSICPDRSAFDRGNRYSVSSLIKQEAIKSEADQIPLDSLRKWKLDVVKGVDEPAVVDMLLQHFSLHGDRVVLVNTSDFGAERHGRRIASEQLTAKPCELVYESFQQSCFFSRFVVERSPSTSSGIREIPTRMPGVEVFEGDCFEVLARMKENSIDGAVTSPPYYNARTYSMWPNIYCYLYDMYNVAREVYRVLKPGSVFLFNIFDYFDNENNIVLSTMGKKRMILGAYIINLFSRVGFLLDGNIVWYKGEIEGKRNFNQGNRSPYYQFPFNCWEHVLDFRKPGPTRNSYEFPTILAAKPVIKFVRGENVLGHSAPFPSEIPDLLIQQMRSGERVLDPFSGSMTTGRAAFRREVRSVSIDLHLAYCQLGLRLLKEEAEAPLFGSVY